MKTIIFDIDGTLTDMWPIEECVLSAMLEEDSSQALANLKQQGTSSCYLLFRKISKQRITKREFYRKYNETFSHLRKSNCLPIPIAYPVISWLKMNTTNFQFVFATGGQRLETEYVLEQFGIKKYFDLASSLSKSDYTFGKKTGLPFRKIKRVYHDCLLITDSESDCIGATLAGIRYEKIVPRMTFSSQKF